MIGKLKGSSFFIWFLIGFVLPLLGTLAAVLYRSERDEPLRECPECGNVSRAAGSGLHALRAGPRIPA